DHVMIGDDRAGAVDEEAGAERDRRGLGTAGLAAEELLKPWRQALERWTLRRIRTLPNRNRDDRRANMLDQIGEAHRRSARRRDRCRLYLLCMCGARHQRWGGCKAGEQRHR